MATVLPIPPSGTPYLDPRTGTVSEPWRRYLLSLQDLSPQIPPIDAQYWVSTGDSALTNERNIGALATGYLKITTALGIATPSSTASIPGTDVTGAALTRTNDTNVTLTLGGSPLTGLLRAISLTLGWTGLLSKARGGTDADLSATGGTSQVLKQTTLGGAVTVGQLATTDITNLVSGTYTPTLTNVLNLDGSAAFVCQYARVGSFVTVTGKVTANPTAAGFVQLGISLPIASAFSASEQCGGTAVAPAVAGQCAGILADATNDRAEMEWTAVDTANRTMVFSFGYQIV